MALNICERLMHYELCVKLWAKASHRMSPGSWAMCSASDKHLFREKYPVTKGPFEKCLVVEILPSSSLADMEKNSAVKFTLNPSSKLLQATATVDGREGVLELRITKISETNAKHDALEKAYIQWAQMYVSLLEASLTHSADHVIKKLTAIPRQLPDGRIVAHAERTRKDGDDSHEQILRSIEKLKEFKDRGILSEDEFNAKKHELLQRL